MDSRSAGALVTCGVVAALAVTLVAGAPGSLPSIALDSTVLFHLERMLALLAGYLALVVVIQRAWRGQLPSALSAQGLTYVTEEATQIATDGLEAHTRELESLRNRLEQLERGVR
jgi:hypothetical protein